jgi:hypothetical protein
MVHFMRHLIIMLLLPWVGLSTVMLWVSQGRSKVEVMINQQASVEKDKEFKSILSGRGKTKAGDPYSFHIYKSTDGVGISTRSEKRGSRILANREFQKKINKADKIIERGLKLDKNGKQVGERAVLTFTDKGPDKVIARVIWTDGAYFHSIESSSLPHILEFEKKYYASGR